MRKAVIVIVIVVGVIFALAKTTFALPDSEIQKMVKADPHFAYVEKTLLDNWKKIPKEYKKHIRTYQLDWISTFRDKEAAELMAMGLSKSQAYAVSTAARNNLLRESMPREIQRKMIFINLDDLAQRYINDENKAARKKYEKLEQAKRDAAEKFWATDITVMNNEIAFQAAAAYDADSKRAAKKLKTLPQRELKALYLLVREHDSTNRYQSILDSVMHSFVALVKDLAGEQPYGLVVRGRLGELVPGTQGSSGNGTYLFYPHETDEVVTIVMEGRTVDYREDKTAKDVVLYFAPILGGDSYGQVVRIDDDHALPSLPPSTKIQKEGVDSRNI